MANTKKKTNTATKKTGVAKKDTVKKTESEKQIKGTSKVVNKKEVKNTPTKKTTNKNTKSEKEVKEVVKEIKKEKRESKFKLNSKQKDIVLVLLAVVLLVIATVLTKEPKLDIELPIELPGEAGFTEINYEEYNKKIEVKEPFVVVIVRDGCHFCDDYKPVVEKVSTNLGLPINYINLSHLSNEDANELITKNKYFRKNQQWGTPTTLFMYGEDIVSSLGGYVDEAGFTNFVKENFKVNNG